MKRIIIIVSFVVMVLILAFVFSKFDSSSDINSAMQAFEHGDYNLAYKEFLALAKTGNQIAQNNVGFLYSKGLGIRQNSQRAFYWYSKSSKQGLPTAISNLASLYQAGRGTQKNIKKAVELYQTAVRYGNPLALNNLGFIYLKGEYLNKDINKGLDMIKTAAEQYNSSLAQFNLGLIFYNGNFGVVKSYKKTLNFLKKAANQNYPDAQFTMSVIYYQGKAVPKDLKKSYFWSYIAYKNGYQKAAESVQLLRKSLTAEDIKQEEKKADIWLKEHPSKSYDAEIAILPQNATK